MTTDVNPYAKARQDHLAEATAWHQAEFPLPADQEWRRKQILSDVEVAASILDDAVKNLRHHSKPFLLKSIAEESHPDPYTQWVSRLISDAVQGANNAVNHLTHGLGWAHGLDAALTEQVRDTEALADRVRLLERLSAAVVAKPGSVKAREALAAAL